MSKPIKTKTYYNFMRVVRLIQAKGYSFSESEEIAERIFSEYNPKGLSILDMVDRVLSKAEYEEQYECQPSSTGIELN